MNRELLQQLYARYSREIYLYLFSLCGSAPPAEDLLQETFLQALLSLSDCHSNARIYYLITAKKRPAISPWNRWRRFLPIAGRNRRNA